MREVDDDYAVECSSEECSWSGLLSETEDEPFEEGSCPLCRSEVEPVD